ncbi:MAG TPA: tetratricopeptide repeat protein [Candidatus Dormibacteraeota bacterium]|nr:tetratricopeptide repeat protein [Candidatus Dormibacteraeota bacterium]
MANLRLALLADYAAANEQSGDKLHVIGGGIRTLSFPLFPATWPRLAVALGLEFTAAECRTPEHSLLIEAKGPSEKPLVKPVAASITLRPDPLRPDESVYFHLVYNLENITFPVEGAYVFSIKVDEAQVGEIALRALTAAGPLPRAIAASGKLSDGYKAFEAGDIAKAQQVFQDVVAEFPEVAMGHNNLGFVLLLQGHPDQALAAFTKARELNYFQPEILDANVACAHYLRGDPAVASIFFQQCLRVYGYAGQAVLFGIDNSHLFPVTLNSAADYVGLIMLNACWSAVASGDRQAALRYLEGAQAADLGRREDESGRNFALSVKRLAEQLI